MQKPVIDRNKLARDVQQAVTFLGSFETVMILGYQAAISQNDIVVSHDEILDMQNALIGSKFDLVKLAGLVIGDPYSPLMQSELTNSESLGLAYARMAKQQGATKELFAAELAYECQFGGANVFTEGVEISEPLVSTEESRDDLFHEAVLQALDADPTLSDAEKKELVAFLNEGVPSEDSLPREGDEVWDYHPDIS
jgi:hypothetical protein